MRHYNSQFTYASPLGLSWRHHYDRQVLLQDATHVTVVRPNGQAFEFVLSGGTWTSSINLTDKLQSITGGWQLHTQADETETYNASGRLLSIANRAGLTQTLVYSTAATPASVAPRPGLLITVIDPAGRQLAFTYDLRSLVKTMTDPAGNVFQYAYNNQALLTTVTYPGTPPAVRTYGYKYSGINPFLANLLTSIRDENNQVFATFTYDEGVARTIGSSLGDALAADPYTLKYNANNTTAVTDARTHADLQLSSRARPVAPHRRQPGLHRVRHELRSTHLQCQRLRCNEHRLQRQPDDVPAQRPARPSRP